MKKHFLLAFLTITLLLAISPAASQAGHFFLGTKGWYTEWDSGILHWLESDIGVSFEQNRLAYDADSEVGDGYLVGPMIGYQSDDGKWSVSFAAMFISSFNQDWEGSAGAMMLEGDVELDRRDYDLAVNYTFSKYFKAYAGYKYQDMDLDFELTFNTGLGAQTDTFDIEADAHIPTFGIGAAYPVHDQVVIGGQIGVLYPLMDMEITNEDGRTDDIIPHSRIGFNTEANITYQPWEHLIIQAGYRYQEFTFKARGPGRTDIIKSVDKTYGPTLSAFYMF